MTRSLAKYIETGATTHFFNWYIGIDKNLDVDLPQPTVLVVDHQNNDDLVPDFTTDELDQVADTDEMIQEATINNESFTESNQASVNMLGKENQQPVTMDNKMPSGKKPFQLKGRLPQRGISRFKPLNRNDSRRFSF